MNKKYGKTLLALTTYNQLKYTTYAVESIMKLDEVPLDLIVFDDCSTDGTVDWCKDKGVQVFDKENPQGLTDSWNAAYRHFRDNKEYKYLIIANNDIIVPTGAITELLKIVSRWPFSVVVPLSTEFGAGHNKDKQGIERIFQGVDNVCE